MVTVHRSGAFRFVIFLNDHSPPHVHVFKGEGCAKIRLDAPHIEASEGLTRAELRSALDEVRDHLSKFINEWERIHG